EAAGTIRRVTQTSTGVGTPTVATDRLQSHNFPDRYVRHYDFDVRIDPNVSPAADAQWRIVPGLADTNSPYVSFEAANHPGYYLRHWNYDFVLARNDGSATFRADATFRRVPGLADSSATSFQSYNFPDRYLRHYDYLLRLDPISTALDRADATFRIPGRRVRGDGGLCDPGPPGWSPQQAEEVSGGVGPAGPRHFFRLESVAVLVGVPAVAHEELRHHVRGRAQQVFGRPLAHEALGGLHVVHPDPVVGLQVDHRTVRGIVG